MTEAAKLCFGHSFNPVARTTFGRSLTAACELFERTTRRYDKPAFGLRSTLINGEPVRVREEVVWARPFCRLLHFKKEQPQPQPEPRLLIIAPCRATTPPCFGERSRRCSRGATSTSP